MPDLFTHYVAVRAPALFVRDRRLVALLVFGTFIPDLASKGLYWVLQCGETYSAATHSILGVLLLSYLACLFVDEKLRSRGFAMLSAGGLIHIAMDLIKDNLGTGAVHPFIPFNSMGLELGWIDPENVVYLIPFDAVVLAIVLGLERRLGRVRQ
ncbi:MAG TPA: hypothetical protein VE981_02685 [Planctomycetota bacterium]|nr:hypothetical protein [Planctomycetota bacterium]